MPIEIRTDSSTGYIVGYHPAVGARAVSIKAIAQRLAAKGKIPHLSDAELRQLALMDDPQADPIVAGKVAKKIKAGLKKTGKAIKKVANNKVVQSITTALGQAVPPPYGTAIQAAQGAAKLGRAVKKGVKEAKEIKKTIDKVASGKAPVKQLKAQAKKLGVNPKVAMSAAVMQKTANMAKAGDKKAAAALAMASDLTKPNPSAKLATAASMAKTYRARGPSGREYSFRLA